jgi:hypothetical protein
MSLHDLMICDKTMGGCGHARHRHTKTQGSAWRPFSGACRTVGSDGTCPCLTFREKGAEK